MKTLIIVLFVILTGCGKSADPEPTFCWKCVIDTKPNNGNPNQTETVNRCAMTEAQAKTFESENSHKTTGVTITTVCTKQ